MADPKDDGRLGTYTTRAIPLETKTAGAEDEKAKDNTTAIETNMAPAGGYTALRTEEDPREDGRFPDKEDVVGADVELRHSRSPVLRDPGDTLPGHGARESAEGGAEVHEYKVYKRRWFGLVQLTLLNIIVSWDVSYMLGPSRMLYEGAAGRPIRPVAWRCDGSQALNNSMY